MTILIENLQNKIALTDNINDLLNKAVELSLKMEDFKIPCEISFLMVDNEYIREINNEHRKIDAPTDVLSFPMTEILEGKLIKGVGDYDFDKNLLLLGDIVISLETALSQAEEYGHSFEREVAFLATHGVFHLLGYDHMVGDEEKIMMDKQEAVLRKMELER
jgi:probable rRNA maturation factor